MTPHPTSASREIGGCRLLLKEKAEADDQWSSLRGRPGSSLRVGRDPLIAPFPPLFQDFLFSRRKSLDKGSKRVYSIQADGRLAQLVAHPLDVREVTSSSLVSSTIDSSLKSDESFLFPAFFATFAFQKLP